MISTATPEKLYIWIAKVFHDVVRDRRLRVILLAAIPAYFLIYGALVAFGTTSADGLCEGLYFYHNAGWASACGRFFTNFANSLTGNVITPVLAAVEGILFLCFSAYLLVRLWNIRTPAWIALITLLMLGNPTTISLYWYPHVFAIYTLAVLLAIVYAYCMARFRTVASLILGILSLALSLGIYQSYIGVAAACAVGTLFLAVLDGRSFSTVRTLFVRFLVGGCGGGILYLILMKLDLAILHISAASRVTDVSFGAILTALPHQIGVAYSTFFSDCFDPRLGRQWLYSILFVLLLAVVIFCAVRLVQKKEYWRTVFCLVLLLLFPVAANVVALVITFQDVTELMRYAAILLFPLVFAVIQRTKAGVWFSWTKLGCFVLTAGIFWTYVISANATANVYNLCYRRNYFAISAMMSDVHDLPEYQNGDRVVLAGFLDYDDLRKEFAETFEYAIGVPENPIFWKDMNGILNARRGFFINYLGVEAGVISYDEYGAAISSEEFSAMPIWPAQGSVAKINDIVVVKLSEEPPIP